MDMMNLASRLKVRFGLGTRPDLRGALYQRLEQLVRDEGESAYLVIATVASDSVGKKDPGRYFSHVVMCRLMERGILQGPEV